LTYSIEAPSLCYSFPLFRVVQTINIYPLTIMWQEKEDESIRLQCNNREEFEENLHKVLSSERTYKVIASLQAMF